MQSKGESAQLCQPSWSCAATALPCSTQLKPEVTLKQVQLPRGAPDPEHGVGVEQAPPNRLLRAVAHQHRVARLGRRPAHHPVDSAAVDHGRLSIWKQGRGREREEASGCGSMQMTLCPVLPVSAVWRLGSPCLPVNSLDLPPLSMTRGRTAPSAAVLLARGTAVAAAERALPLPPLPPFVPGAGAAAAVTAARPRRILWREATARACLGPQQLYASIVGSACMQRGLDTVPDGLLESQKTVNIDFGRMRHGTGRTEVVMFCLLWLPLRATGGPLSIRSAAHYSETPQPQPETP